MRTPRCCYPASTAYWLNWFSLNPQDITDIFYLTNNLLSGISFVTYILFIVKQQAYNKYGFIVLFSHFQNNPRCEWQKAVYVHVCVCVCVCVCVLCWEAGHHFALPFFSISVSNLFSFWFMMFLSVHWTAGRPHRGVSWKNISKLQTDHNDDRWTNVRQTGGQDRTLLHTHVIGLVAVPPLGVCRPGSQGVADEGVPVDGPPWWRSACRDIGFSGLIHMGKKERVKNEIKGDIGLRSNSHAGDRSAQQTVLAC